MSWTISPGWDQYVYGDILRHFQQTSIFPKEKEGGERNGMIGETMVSFLNEVPT